jgi:hypothetical protein
MICLPVIKPDTDVLRKTYSPGKWAAITGKENLAVFLRNLRQFLT